MVGLHYPKQIERLQAIRHRLRLECMHGRRGIVDLRARLLVGKWFQGNGPNAHCR
jgi:hypothetical protein